MAKLTIALWSAVLTIVVLVIYKFVINPQIVVTPSRKHLSDCPERWKFDGTNCIPQYETKCIAFNPKTIQTIQQACNIAKKCGTDWDGMCL